MLAPDHLSPYEVEPQQIKFVPKDDWGEARRGIFLKNWGSARHSNKNSGRQPPLIGNGLRHCVINSGKGLVLKDQNRALTDEPAKWTWGTQHVVVHRTMETARRGFKSHRGDVCNCCFFCTFYLHSAEWCCLTPEHTLWVHCKFLWTHLISDIMTILETKPHQTAKTYEGCKANKSIYKP